MFLNLSQLGAPNIMHPKVCWFGLVDEIPANVAEVCSNYCFNILVGHGLLRLIMCLPCANLHI